MNAAWRICICFLFDCNELSFQAPAVVTRAMPGIRERWCFLRTENGLRNSSSCWQESRLYIWGLYKLEIFFSWLITTDYSHKYLFRRCSEILVPLEFMWKLMPASPVPDFFSSSFSSYFPCYALKRVIWEHNVIGFSCAFYFSVLKLCILRARLTYSVNYQWFYFILEVKFKLGFIGPGSLSYSSF